MTSDLANKVEAIGRRLKFQQSKDHRNQGPAKMTFESIIAFSYQFPKNLFLVNKNMHLGRTLENMSYDIYRFDGNGKYRLIPTEDFNMDFFKTLKVINKL